MCLREERKLGGAGSQRMCFVYVWLLSKSGTVLVKRPIPSEIKIFVIVIITSWNDTLDSFLGGSKQCILGLPWWSCS